MLYLLFAVLMRVARMAHTATPLPDGAVLIAGGFTDSAASPAHAELYDPALQRFESLPPMQMVRHSHSATRLPNGLVLLAGGYGRGGAVTNHTELYDPRTRRFLPSAPMREPRAGHIAVPLADGRVLIAGGVGPDWRFLASAELYDPKAGSFSPTGAMSVARESHVGVRLADGQVLVIGGHRGRREQITIYASTERYDPATGRFIAGGSMRQRRHKHDALLLRDGRVLVTGGSDERDDRGAYASTELYDPALHRFEAGPAMHRARYKHAGSSLLLPDGSVFIGGGATEAERWDARTSRFALVEEPDGLAGQFSAVAPLPQGGVLITGGYGGGTGPRASSWVYHPKER
jgi:hypothetical protein